MVLQIGQIHLTVSNKRVAVVWVDYPTQHVVVTQPPAFGEERLERLWSKERHMIRMETLWQFQGTIQVPENVVVTPYVLSDLWALYSLTPDSIVTNLVRPAKNIFNTLSEGVAKFGSPEARRKKIIARAP